MAGPIIFFEFLNFFFYSNVHKSLDPTIFCLFLDRLQRLLLAGQDGDGGGGARCCLRCRSSTAWGRTPYRIA
ncbi:hypothetical protein HanOQP8_Chr14g0507951 [Helianthus annuus]|nr:hypothetical protein HanOQP8_Chr14g0507951 [Helianthus annuus]